MVLHVLLCSALSQHHGLMYGFLLLWAFCIGLSVNGHVIDGPFHDAKESMISHLERFERGLRRRTSQSRRTLEPLDRDRSLSRPPRSHAHAQPTPCFHGCNLTLTPQFRRRGDYRTAPKVADCTTASSDFSLMVSSHTFPWGTGKHSRLFALDSGSSTTQFVRGRPWGLQAINAHTVGFLTTVTDTDHDATKSSGQNYTFQDLYTQQSFAVPLQFPTHDVWYSRVTKTIFYLSIRQRRLTRACPPFSQGPLYLLESLVECDLSGRTVWELPFEEVGCHRPLNIRKASTPPSCLCLC